MKKVWAKIQGFFIKLFGGLRKFEKFVNDNMGDIIAIVGELLKYASSPILGEVLQYLPEKFKTLSLDAQQKVIDLLAKAINKLEISQDCLSKGTNAEVILCFLNAFGKRSPIDRQSTAAKLAATLLQIKSEEELATPLTDSQADYLAAEYFFSKKIDSLEAAA